MLAELTNDWKDILQPEFEKPYWHKLEAAVEEEYAAHKVFPPKELIFNGLNTTSFADTKVVLLGQDPYHGEGQAHGLAFSVLKGTRIPPSLRNIYKELQSDLGLDIPTHGELTSWARQGVLLLNTTLTVREGAANSHKKLGWEKFTDSVIAALGSRPEPVIFLLWGNHAQKKKPLITGSQHLVLCGVHPSPLSASGGFFGCKHFSQTNQFLAANGLTPIDWQIV